MADAGRFGDLVITDPRMMRALAHPARLAILDILRREGPASATELAPRIGVTPSAASWHLRHLARFGLIRDGDPHPDGRARRWETAVRGFRVDVPADPADVEGRTAALTLLRGLMVNSQAVPARWLADVEPTLDTDWSRAAGFSDTRLVVDAAELESILDRVEEILAPYVNRAASQRPAGTRGVRFLRYALPEAQDADSGSS
ncbi:helix-turn-helix domain-containing protein [Catenulispora yoronensis]|uniref:Helix-turn-helix domain-containing protein n=1 Tax=Catenulispora yoronensis TaxID=450799 RepID=A0ABN2V780_9ACTN